MRNRAVHLTLPLLGLFTLCAAAALPERARAQGTPEQQAACEMDARRLCGQYIPDIDRITSCMVAKRRQLSARCRATIVKRRGR
jgi:hypothetical protein